MSVTSSVYVVEFTAVYIRLSDRAINTMLYHARHTL